MSYIRTLTQFRLILKITLLFRKFLLTGNSSFSKACFKERAKTIKLANIQETQTRVLKENIPFIINEFNSTINAHIIKNMSYDVMFG